LAPVYRRSGVAAVDAKNTGAPPIFFRHFVDYDVQTVGLGIRVLDHGIRYRANQLAFLVDRAAGPKFHSYHRHRCSSPIFIFITVTR